MRSNGHKPSILGTALGYQYQQLGDLQDLEASLKNCQAAVDIIPERHPERAQYLKNLAVSLIDRYIRLGDLHDLETAVKHNKVILDLTPQGHPNMPTYLNTLSVSLIVRYHRYGDLHDLKDAVDNTQAAINLTPPGHPDLPEYLNSLARSLKYQYARSANPQYLEAALKNDQDSVDLAPHHPERPKYLSSLASSLIFKYRKYGDLKDLEAAVKNDRAAVKLLPINHPNLPGLLQNLALSCTDRYMMFHDPQDLENAFVYYENFFKTTMLLPTHGWIVASQNWAALAELYRPSEILRAYSATFSLLPEILWIGNSLSIRQDVNADIKIGHITSRAVTACIKYGYITSAIEFLEQGLATTFQQMLQLKSDVDGLALKDAEELKWISSQLYSGASNDPKGLAVKRSKLLDRIRNQPGQKYFLLPKPYTYLCQASKNGPVVILNSHKDCCDAIIILNESAKPLHVSLTSATLAQLEHSRAILNEVLQRCNARSRESASSRLFGAQETLSSKPTQECFKEMLSWLWTHVVEPIFKELESHGIVEGRLWWCPVGAFTGLPLHAAAPSDQFIQSYTSTLGALINSVPKKSSSSPVKIGLVGVTHIDSHGGSPLPGVDQEIEMIQTIVKKPHTIHSVSGEQATLESVKQQFNTCSWLHFACHGMQDLQDPPKSCLQLYNGSLDLEHILKMPLSNAEFVFLAACQTAMGDTQLVNESFHLGGGFISAGFRGTIGTLWSMQDEDGPLVAEIVYRHLFLGKKPQAEEAAKTLQLAVREMRDKNMAYEHWVPFIHMGV
ncbi:CHAT domain-containing protein [Mycena rebaudengoi]|nr:CHAT domain-containing protein [Mycena rebaudengoi]